MSSSTGDLYQRSPAVEDLPLVVVSKDRSTGNFQAILDKFFPKNSKYVVVPAAQVRAYEKVCKNGWIVVAEPKRGLAAADAFLGSDVFPPLTSTNYYECPFVLKAVDDIVHIQRGVVCENGELDFMECTTEDLHAALAEMLHALITFGGHLGGFASGDVRCMRPQMRYCTGLVTVLDSLQLRRRSADLVYCQDVACKSDWALVSKAFERGGFLVRCGYYMYVHTCFRCIHL